ncbi:MAG TPA: hypothetical protein VGD77_01560 [Gemmatimonadaceae bacterium]|jgi:hypothetical protein
MALIPCSAPTCDLEPAPMTALVPVPRPETTGWAAFWGRDDVYYARHAGSAGEPDRWYRLGVADEGVPHLLPASWRRSTGEQRAVPAHGPTRTMLVGTLGAGHDGTRCSVVRVPSTQRRA